MVNLPIFTAFECQKFELFPGEPAGSGIKRDILSGVTLIAGINGLGKTTLLMMLLRLLTGPFDLSGFGLPAEIGSVLPEAPIRLRPEPARFFGQRVADNARDATATIELAFGAKNLRVTRNLQNLSLQSFAVGKQESTGPDAEEAYQAEMCSLMNLSSFVDVLLVLHHMLFFPERRPGALWDEDAQRHLMRAIFLPKQAAAKVADLERKVGSADSNARNINAILTQQRRKLAEAEQKHAAAPGIRNALRSSEQLLDADIAKRGELEAKRDGLEKHRRQAKLDFERAKIELEDAERAVERIKFVVIGRMFPDMPDTARLTILNLLGKGQCLVCGSDSEEEKARLEHLLTENICPVCKTKQPKVTNVVTNREVEATRLKAARKKVQQASEEEGAQKERLLNFEIAYDTVIKEMKVLTDRIQALEFKVYGLRAELPTPTQEIKSLREYVGRLEKDVSEAKARRARHARELRKVLEPVNGRVVRKSKRLSDTFRRVCAELLQEEVELVRIEGESGVAQQDEQFRVPLFQADMSSAARPGLSRRRSPQDVSESQRELMDLAFRFALTEVSNSGRDTTFIMETPEASLDGVAMERVGKALCKFASHGKNRLIATSNLTNAGMIAYLFGGPTEAAKELKRRRDHTIDLLVLAAKNRALQLDRSGRYAELLADALSGSAGV